MRKIEIKMYQTRIRPLNEPDSAYSIIMQRTVQESISVVQGVQNEFDGEQELR